MLDFIKAALPWVAIGLSVAVCAARLPGKIAKDKDAKSKGNKSENTYMAMGMCLGMCIGMLVGKYLYDNVNTGMCIGMCCGCMIGSTMPLKKKQDSKQS